MKRVFSGLLVAVVTTASQAAPCLRYADLVALDGLLSRETFPEQPNYENIEAGDRPATYFFVSPSPSTCVDADEHQDAFAAVGKLQLVFDGKANEYDRLRPYLGKRVICRGRLFQAISGHHHSRVLLDDARCEPAIAPGQSDRRAHNEAAK